MSTWHRVSFGKFDAVDSVIDSLGIRYRKIPEPHGYYLITFAIEESDPRWPLVAELIREKNTLDLFNTIFSNEEICQAEWVRLIPRFEQGYPQPKVGMMWRDIAYENACRHCGAGYRQIRPLRLLREPQLGKYDLMSLFWTYSLFCTPRVTEVLRTHEIRGYEVWEALLHRSNEPSQTVAQLVFPYVSKGGLARQDRLHPRTCPECGITTYAPHLRGRMRYQRKALHAGLDIQLSEEWFGNGGRSPYREILISNRLARLIIEEGWRGAALKPVDLV